MRAKLTQAISICMVLMMLSFQSLFGQLVPYISYPIGDSDSDTEKPLENENRSSTDLEVASNFYAIAPNVMWPATQVECFYLLADYANIGDSAAVEATAGNTIVDDNTGIEVFADSFIVELLEPGNSFENTPFQNCFTPDGSITSYTGIYSINSDCPDPNPGNNKQTFEFETTEFTFSKETGATQIIAPAAGNWDNGEPHSWAYGNYYFIVQGCPVLANEAIFSIGNADDPGIAGKLLNIYLYHWEEDTNQDGNMDPDERTIVGAHFYEIEGTEQPQDLISVELLSFPEFQGPVELNGQEAYVLMIEYLTIDEVDVFFTASDEYDYGAQMFVSGINGAPRYGSFLGVNGDLDSEPYSSIGFGTDLVPVARLTLGEMIIDAVDEVSISGQSLQISPNPADDFIKIRIPETDAFQKGYLVIYDQQGRLVSYKKIELNQTGEIIQDVSYLPNGTYFVYFKAGETAISESFIVLH